MVARCPASESNDTHDSFRKTVIVIAIDSSRYVRSTFKLSISWPESIIHARELCFLFEVKSFEL